MIVEKVLAVRPDGVHEVLEVIAVSVGSTRRSWVVHVRPPLPTPELPEGGGVLVGLASIPPGGDGSTTRALFGARAVPAGTKLYTTPELPEGEGGPHAPAQGECGQVIASRENGHRVFRFIPTALAFEIADKQPSARPLDALQKEPFKVYASPTSARELPSIDELLPLLNTDDLAFSTWRDSVPDKHWAKMDLSALRIGYELGKAIKGESHAS